MKFIKRSLISYPEENKDRAGNPDGEAGYINKGVEAIFTEVSESDDQVVSKHGCGG